MDLFFKRERVKQSGGSPDSKSHNRCHVLQPSDTRLARNKRVIALCWKGVNYFWFTSLSDTAAHLDCKTCSQRACLCKTFQLCSSSTLSRTPLFPNNFRRIAFGSFLMFEMTNVRWPEEVWRLSILLIPSSLAKAEGLDLLPATRDFHTNGLIDAGITAGGCWTSQESIINSREFSSFIACISP